jgi:hypothetical protein
MPLLMQAGVADLGEEAGEFGEGGGEDLLAGQGEFGL